MKTQSDHWHATRDAALSGLLAGHPDESYVWAAENATYIADKIHGQIPDADPAGWPEPRQQCAWPQPRT